MWAMVAGGVGAKSIRKLRRHAKRDVPLRDASTAPWASTNPCEVIDLPALPASTEIRYLTMPQVQALAPAAVPGEHQQLDRALYLTAAMTGLRQGELIALRWQDIAWDDRRVRVVRQLRSRPVRPPKSRRSARSVPLSSHLARDLRVWQQAPRLRDPDALVFAEPASGDVLRRGALMRRYRRTLKAAKIDPHRFHDLRHTFGTAMAVAGVPMRTLQEWMGHRDIATTQRYADYAPNEREVEMVDRAFRGADRA